MKLTAPVEPNDCGMQGVVFKNEPGALLIRQPVLDEGKI